MLSYTHDDGEIILNPVIHHHLPSLKSLYITCSSFTESNIQEPNHFETNSLERLIASIADFINAAGYCCNFMAQYCAFSGCEDKSTEKRNFYQYIDCTYLQSL